MPLTSGTRLGPYEILAPLGAGGMGEVYRARDTKLGREVAIKVLPEVFSRDPEKLARFQREAHLLASLNHPNVAAIHGLEESGGQQFLVMELVEGETLAERLGRGPMPVEEALVLFQHIAEGLEAAHVKGIVHRDLKPSNIKITPEGKPKVLDFGLAKALAGETAVQDLSQSPTLTRDATETGVLLGTAPYMSPEQARGKPVDKRTDIWAFGCCLYEALTGKAAFLGGTVSDTLAAVLKTEPDWKALPLESPWLLGRVLRRCLQKDMRERFHDMADVRLQLQETSTEQIPLGEFPRATTRRAPRAMPWILAALFALGAGVAGWFLRPTPVRPVTKLRMGVARAKRLGSVGAGTNLRMSRTNLALSPDGRHLVYSGGDERGFRLYVRAMDEFESEPIAGTEGGVGPFFSPDGQWVGFWAGGTLKKVRLEGGPPMDLCEVPLPVGASWGADETIVFGQVRGGILRISAGGGAAEPVTTLAEGESSHRLPHLLPGGEVMLYTVRKHPWGSWDKAQIVAQSLEGSGERKLLIENGADGRHSPTGHLVFIRLGALMAAPFDLERLEVTGQAAAVLGDVRQAANTQHGGHETGAAQFNFSASGTMVFVPGGVYPDLEDSLVWVDREGVAEPLQAPAAPYFAPRISPDGRRVAFTTLGLNEDIWVHDISRRASTRLTTEESADSRPLWTPDGSRIAFTSDKSGRNRMYWMPADGSGEPERLTTIEETRPATWSPDGQVLAFLVRVPGQGHDIWIFSLEGEPRPFIESPFSEAYPEFSPDGRWLAYVSDQSGREEVYVTPYPGPGPRVQVSTEGGFSPAWAGNGRELFYRGLEDSEGISSMMVADFATETLVAGRPRELFRDVYAGASALRNYDVTPDGQRFLMVQSGPRPWWQPVTDIEVVLNWHEELKRLVPIDN